MKSSLAFYIGISMLIPGLLAGCGQPGPLYMPKLPAKPAPAVSTPGVSAPAEPAVFPSTVPASPR